MILLSMADVNGRGMVSYWDQAFLSNRTEHKSGLGDEDLQPSPGTEKWGEWG
jgi:hypothetical protein